MLCSNRLSYIAVENGFSLVWLQLSRLSAGQVKANFLLEFFVLSRVHGLRLIPQVSCKPVVLKNKWPLASLSSFGDTLIEGLYKTVITAIELVR